MEAVTVAVGPRVLESRKLQPIQSLLVEAVAAELTTGPSWVKLVEVEALEATSSWVTTWLVFRPP